MKAKPIHLVKFHPHLAAQSWDLSAGVVEPVRILALHGWLDNSATFAGLAQQLHGVQLLAVDFAGHGYSEHRSPDASYHFLDWVGEVIRVADELGWQQFTLLGHSMGAAIATLVAATVPERIERVVALEGLVPLTAPAANLPLRLRQHLDQRAAIATKLPALYPSVEAAVAARLKASDIKNVAALTPMVERNLRKSVDGYSWRSDPRLKTPSAWRLTTAQVEAFLERICCPFLFVRASPGLAIDSAELSAYERRIAKLEKHELLGGHHVHLENPEVVAPVIQAFLDMEQAMT